MAFVTQCRCRGWFPRRAVNAIVGGLFIAVLLISARRVSSSQLALAIAACCVLTPFFIFNAASYHSHVAAALLVGVFLFFGLRYLAKGYRSDAFILGACIGYIGLTRYYTAILLIIPFILWLFLKRRNLLYQGPLWIGAGGVPFLLALLFYHYAIFDQPLASTYSLTPTEELFITLDAEGLSDGLRQTRPRIAELMLWTSPALFLTYLACLAIKIKTKSLEFYDLIFPLFFFGFILFASDGGNRYGPRYYFEAYGPLLLTVASAAKPMISWAGKVSAQGIFVHIIVITVIHSVCAYVYIAKEYLHITRERQDVYRLATEIGIEKAVVVINSDTGVKWPMEIPDLARNGPSLSRDVLFARGDVTNPLEIQHVFPDRLVWVYERDPGAIHGRLSAVETVAQQSLSQPGDK
jgi:4-amino-4-deoxy-L-arabinose transferase-like glycosyltransferase